MRIEQDSTAEAGVDPQLLEMVTQAVAQALIQEIVREVLEARKAPKAVPARISRYNALPRGLDVHRSFQDIPEDWADQFLPVEPLPVVYAFQEPIQEGSALRPFASDPLPKSKRRLVETLTKRGKQQGRWIGECEHGIAHNCPDAGWRPKTEEIPNPILAVWRRDKRFNGGGYWIDPGDGARVVVQDTYKPDWTRDDKIQQREQTRRKWSEWLDTKSPVEQLEANMLAQMNGGR